MVEDEIREIDGDKIMYGFMGHRKEFQFILSAVRSQC